MKTQIRLVSLSISLALSGIACASTQQGLLINYLPATSVDPHCQNSMQIQTWNGSGSPATGNSTTPIGPGGSTTGAQMISSGVTPAPTPGNNQVYFELVPAQGSTTPLICPNYAPPDAPAPGSNNPSVTSNSFKLDAPDFMTTQPMPTVTVQYTGCQPTTVGGSTYQPTFTCTYSGFTAGVTPKNQINMSQVPDAVAYIGSNYDWKANPLLSLGANFNDTNTYPNGYKIPGQRIYYNLTLTTPGTLNNPISLTHSSNRANPAMGMDFSGTTGSSPTGQFAIGGAADNRNNISTINSSDDTAPLLAPQDNQLQTCSAGKSESGQAYYQCQVNICACDPGLPASSVGSCYINGTGSPILAAITSGDSETANYLDSSSFSCAGQTPGQAGPVFQSFNLFLEKPFLAASVQDLANYNVSQAVTKYGSTYPAAPGTTFPGMVRLVIPVQSGGVSGIPLGQYFIDGINADGTPSFLNSPGEATYQIVPAAVTTGTNKTICGKNYPALPNGFNTTQTMTPGVEPILSNATATCDWGPIKIQPGVDNAGTPDQDGLKLSIDSTNGLLLVDASQFKPTTGSTQGGLYQVTIQATDAEPGSTGTVYQTIYLNVSSLNQSEYSATGSPLGAGSLGFSPLTPFNSAWIYMPGYVTSNNPNGPTSSSGSSTTSPGSSSNTTGSNNVCKTQPDPTNHSANQTSSDPCVIYSDTLNQVASAGTPVQYVTADMMWIAFANSADSFPMPDGPGGSYTLSPINNNFFTSQSVTPNPDTTTIQDVVSYFSTNNPNVRFILTSELDNPVMGELSQMQDTLAPNQTPGTDFTQLDRLVWSTTLPFVPSGNPNSNLLSGLQFDVEPFKNSPTAAEYYKRVSDILARHGKVFETFAFADAAMPEGTSLNIPTPSITMAMGPLGIFLPSMYDVGNATDPNYASTYASNFMPGTPNVIDNNCHWSGSFAYNYTLSGHSMDGVPLPIQGYCNLSLTDTISNDAMLLGYTEKMPTDQPESNSNGLFTNMLSAYGGHFQMAVPSQGSAENYTAQIVINPVCSVNNEQGSNPNGTLEPLDMAVVKQDPYSAHLGPDVCSSTPGANMVNVIPGLPSNFAYGGTIPTSITDVINAVGADQKNRITDANLNAAMPLIISQLKPLTYYMGTDQYCVSQQGAGFSPSTDHPNETWEDACRYLIYLSNPNNETGSPVIQTFSGLNNGTPSQDTYIQALISFAQGNFDTQFNTGKAMDIGTPATNPTNLGLAMYSLASESVIGCFAGESHALKENCLLGLPVTTPLNDPSGGNVAPVGHVSITVQKAIYINPTSYSLTWVLNCPGTTAPSDLSSSISTAAVTGSGPRTSLSMVAGAGKTCGASSTETFSTYGGYTVSPSSQVSVSLVNSQFQAITPSVTTTLSTSSSTQLNPVWFDVYQYTQPSSGASVTIQKASYISSTSYSITWVLNCTTAPSNLSSSISTAAVTGSGPRKSLSMVAGAGKVCGAPYTASFSTYGGYTVSPGNQVSLALVDSKFQEITKAQTAPLTSP